MSGEYLWLLALMGTLLLGFALGYRQTLVKDQECRSLRRSLESLLVSLNNHMPGWKPWEETADRIITTGQLPLATLRERIDIATALSSTLWESPGRGAVLLDRKKHIQRVNPWACRRLEVDEPAAQGRDYLEWFGNTELDARIDEVLAGEPTARALISEESDILRYYDMRVLPVGRGAEHGVLLVIRDVTSRRQVNRMRTEFITNVSHELQTPLTSIRGYAECLLGGALGNPDVNRRFINTIQTEATRLSGLVEDLLVLARLEAGQLQLEPAPERLQPVLEDLCHRWQPRVDAAGVELELQVDPQLPAAMVDRNGLRRIFDQLLENAVRYTPDEGQITVEASLRNEHLCISIRDTGPGIPEDCLTRIFERFYRVETARSRAAGGTGLGLAIVKGLVHAHNGRVWAEASEEGACIRFTLPATSVPAPKPTSIHLS